jgi:NAD-dependent dihydropyrimidine dehydrogenase PreA subunit
MRYSVVVAIFVFCSMVYSVQFVEARPGKRYDERTKMCRVIGDGVLDWESEPWGKGGIKFREVCKSCHTQKNDKGASFVHAETYTAEGWNKFFVKRNKKCAQDGSWDALSADEIQLVNDYLYRNGNWTYDPNDVDSCG